MKNQRISLVAAASFVSVLMLVGAGCPASSGKPGAGGDGGNAVSAPSPVAPAANQDGSADAGGTTGTAGKPTGTKPGTEPAPVAADTRFPVTYKIAAVGDSRQSGTVTLTAMAGDHTKVDIQLENATSLSQYAAVYTGTCADAKFNEAYKLIQLVKGYSTTTLDVNVAKLLATPYMIKVKRDPASTTQPYAACGNLK